MGYFRETQLSSNVPHYYSKDKSTEDLTPLFKDIKMDIEAIRAKVRTGKYIISFTHTEKVRLRKIEAEEIEEAICNGTIIEPYPDDPRGASCLVLGFATRDRPLHVICGRLEEDEVLIITAYEPDLKEWEADWKTRKKGD